MPSRFSVHVITQEQEWDRSQKAWEGLLQESTAFEARLFLSHEWLTAWWRWLGQGQLMILTARVGDTLAAAAPLFLTPLPFARLIRFIGTGHADYGDFLAHRRHEGAIRGLWEWLFTHRNLWDILLLSELPQKSVALKSFFPPPPWAGFVVLRGEVCHRLPLNGRGKVSWRGRVSRRLQRHLRRRERQIRRIFSVTFTRVEDEKELSRAMGLLFALHRLRWGSLGQTGVFLSPKVRAFHEEFSRRALRRGWLRLHSLILNGSPVAIYYAFCHGRYSGFYTCGFHPTFRRYSVGTVLLAHVIDEAEREGAVVFDFMRGDESYKHLFGTAISHNQHLIVWQKDKGVSRAFASLLMAATQLSLRLKRWLQR